MDQGKGYTTVESIKIPGRIYLFRSDEEVASILAEVSMQVEVEEERQLSAACDLECESHSDSVSLCSINVDDNQTWCSEGNSSESSAASDDDDVPLQPFLSTGPLCIIARRKPMSGKKRKRQSRNPASEDYFEGTDIIGDKEPAEQGSEPGQPQRSAKKHRRFSADDDAYIYNQVNNRTEERLYQLWHRLGEHFGCSAAAVSCRWRNHLRYRSDNATASVIGTALPPSSATTSSNAVSSSRVVPVRSSGTILATAPNNAPALDEHATTTVAPLPLNSKSFSATALVIEQYYPHAFNHGSLEAADLEYLLCCVYLHLRDHGGADTLCELWLQLGAEFGVSVWNFLSMWKTFLKKTFDTYKSYWNQGNENVTFCVYFYIGLLFTIVLFFCYEL